MAFKKKKKTVFYTSYNNNICWYQGRKGTYDIKVKQSTIDIKVQRVPFSDIWKFWEGKSCNRTNRRRKITVTKFMIYWHEFYLV